MAEVNIAKDVVEKYKEKEVVAFVTKKLKQFNRQTEYGEMDMELQLYIDILSALNDKMNAE